MLEREQLPVDVVRRRRALELLEVLREPVAGELFLDFDGRLELALVVLDALFHPGERLERRFLGERRHRVVDALLRLRATLAGDEQILLALRFLDLVVQIAQRVLELFGLELVLLPRLRQLLAVRVVLGLAHERLLGEIVAVLRDREPRLVLPVGALLELGVGLVAQPLLVGDRRGDLLLRLGKLRPHVRDDLIQHLLGIFGPRDQVVDVRPQQGRKTIEKAHGQRASRYVPISRRCDASDTVMPSYAARNSS